MSQKSISPADEIWTIIKESLILVKGVGMDARFRGHDKCEAKMKWGAENDL